MSESKQNKRTPEGSIEKMKRISWLFGGVILTTKETDFRSAVEKIAEKTLISTLPMIFELREGNAEFEKYLITELFPEFSNYQEYLKSRGGNVNVE